MDLERLKTLEAISEEMTDKGFVSGLNCMVIKDGKEVFYCQSGYRDMENKLKVERDTIFKIYSMTKPITAAAAMILLEEGKIDLLSSVADFLPGFSDLTVYKEDGPVPSEKPVTIGNLLNMTSGIVYPGESNKAERICNKMMEDVIAGLHNGKPMTTLEIANRIGKNPLAFTPGEKWQYGFSADILGAVIEVVSGMRLGEFLEKRLFEPLGMKDTGFFVPEDKRHRMAKVYRGTDAGLKEEITENLGISHNREMPPAFEAGGAGLTSTINDYSKFTQMLLNKGELNGTRIMSESTVEFMTNSHITKAQEKGTREWESLAGYTYGNLMRIMKYPEYSAGLCSAGEYGWDGWLGTYMMNDPLHNLTFLLMYQKVDAGTTEYTRKMRNVVFSAV